MRSISTNAYLWAVIAIEYKFAKPYNCYHRKHKQMFYKWKLQYKLSTNMCVHQQKLTGSIEKCVSDLGMNANACHSIDMWVV